MAKEEIWVLYDGKAGHLSQSQGLAERLAQRTGAQVKTVEAYPKAGLLRLLAVWLCRLGVVWPRMFRRFYHCKLPSGKPQQIISFGGKVVPLNVTLAALYGCDNILIGNRYRLPVTLFSVVVNARDERIPNQVVAQVPFSCASKGHSAGERQCLTDLKRSSRPLWLLLLGGEGSGFSYTDQDWQQLKAAMIRLAQQHGIRWLVSNSRRTPAAGTALLSDPELQDYCQQRISYQQGGPGLGPFLQAAERIFVTADSLSMVTEAIASSATAPVAGLVPEVVAGGESVHQRTLRHYQQRRWLEMVPIASLAEFQPTHPEILATYHQVLDATVTEVIDGLTSVPESIGATERYYPQSY
ncbi:ELM1/GtrOC1 family putative glycosyltransferase [Marinobacterium sp. YM272]|uniref:ELM1/GtrOC1 family putative glycosyltransferase n=1 Tax=Marinobacterium sp. YM272 TaxID=3421654 RepID=UPI003D7FE515